MTPQVAVLVRDDAPASALEAFGAEFEVVGAEFEGIGAALDVVGAELEVPLVTGEKVRYANLDNAASTSSLVAVERAVSAFLPWYSSVHRGAGFASLVSTDAYLPAARSSGRSSALARMITSCSRATRPTHSTCLRSRCRRGPP